MIKEESLFQVDLSFFFFFPEPLSGIPLIDGFSLPFLAGIKMH